MIKSHSFRYFQRKIGNASTFLLKKQKSAKFLVIQVMKEILF